MEENKTQKTDPIEFWFGEVEREDAKRFIEAFGRVSSKLVLFYLGYRLGKRRYSKPAVNLVVINPPANL